MRPGLMDSRNRILTDARQPWIAASFQAEKYVRHVLGRAIWGLASLDDRRVEIILSAPDPFIFVGKAIDYQDRKFQLRDP
jgi:hypothetical protein